MPHERMQSDQYLCGCEGGPSECDNGGWRTALNYLAEDLCGFWVVCEWERSRSQVLTIMYTSCSSCVLCSRGF